MRRALITLSLCGLALTGCGTVVPSLGYRSTAALPKVPVRVQLAIELEARPPLIDPDYQEELAKADDPLLGQSLKDAVERDLTENGPFTVDPLSPDATLKLRVDASVRGDDTAWGWVPPFFLPALGLPTYSRRISVTVRAELIHTSGVLLADAAARAECRRYSGWYYGGEIDLSCATAPVLEELRTRLSEKSERVLSVLARLPRPPLPPPTWAPGTGPVVAVFDFEGDLAGNGPLSGELAGYLATRLAERIGYRVVPPEQVRARLLQEKQQSFRACYDSSCQIELGRALAAQKTVATRVLRAGEVCALTTTFYDLGTETTERATSVRTRCEPDALLLGVDQVVAQLESGS